MVAIAPFRALRYHPQTFSDLSAVVAPPYDVISPAERDLLHARSPYNVVRLILGKDAPADTDTDNRYTRARQTLDDWRRREILVREEQEAIYVVDHAFQWQGERRRRTGLIARLEFSGSVPGGVLRHEATFAGPTADRTKLMEAVRAQLSPIFCVAPDPRQAIARQLAKVMQAPPAATAALRPSPAPRPSDADGRGGRRECRRTESDGRPVAAGQTTGSALGADEDVRLWAVTDPARIATIQHELSDASVLIADGHHRFEVALAHRQWCSGVMAYVGLMSDPGVHIQPIHRVMRGAAPAWRASLEALCDLTPASGADDVARWLAATDAHGAFGGYDGRAYYRAQIKPEALARWLSSPTVSLALAGLDVTILHQLLLPQLGPSAPELQYTADAASAAALVGSGAGQWAWLLRPLSLSQVFALASQGQLLPQKSTYFYPKVLTGLALNPFD